ncbi:hypothetical protein [Archangium sp.]|uniref:hypothetical protein n=1 Tax=Archangium sp. TaxID=1872627 RepID=UPI00286BA3A0|nr:hypothetical protein [Archangium sp.]
MQLPFEQWLTSQSLTADATSLFGEAVTCYKTGAYRAALIMSYLAFQSTIRDRALAASLPTAIPPGQWQNHQSNLRKDDEWDQTTFDIIRQKNPAPIFVISEDLRDQVLYWKNRRNDCAHFKSNAIGAPHVEAFWMFIQSNLAKFVVNGSAGALLSKIERHYDPNFTPPSTDPLPLATEIATAIEQKALSSFFEQLEKIFTYQFGQSLYFRPELPHFLEAIFRQKDSCVQTETAKFISSREPLLLDFLRRYPSRVQLFASDAALIRKLWYSQLFAGGYRDFPLYAALLRNGLIPLSEVLEAHVLIISRIKGDVPHEEHVPDLIASNFFQKLEEQAFDEGRINSFGWGNDNAALICWYLGRFPISVLAVRSISGCFTGTYYPFNARDAINSFFENNPQKRDEFRSIAAKENISLPSRIPALQDPPHIQ